MARAYKWNTKPFEDAFAKVGMDRLEAAAKIVRDDAKAILSKKIAGSKAKTKDITRAIPKGRTDIWMERNPGALIETIRVVRQHGDKTRNIWIMAGNFKTWWATHIEFGRAGWKGGAKSFLRPALKNAPSKIKGVLEGGHGETGDSKYNWTG